ncbi:MAG TPA: DUF3127 domain-containing protein [Chitinophagaceae bacterium]|nr:DUF3127 domain-containing protein [Chitinophagaceae bacterium]
MASFDMIGKLKVKNEIQKVSEKFEKREFVITIDEDSEYPQYITLQLTQSKCSLLDNFQIGDTLKVFFNLRGREWTGNDGVTKHFNSLEAWKIENQSEKKVQTQETLTPTSYPEEQKKAIDINDSLKHNDSDSDDLPF